MGLVIRPQFPTKVVVFYDNTQGKDASSSELKAIFFLSLLFPFCGIL